MERESMFMLRKNQYVSSSQGISSPHLDLKCNPSPNNSKFYCRCAKTDSKVYMDGEQHRITNTILKEKNEVGGLTLPNFKITINLQ